MSRHHSLLAITIFGCAFIFTTKAQLFADAIPIRELRRTTEVSFENEVLPILQANCLACHSETERQGELVLESPQQILSGGDTGPAIVPGKPGESLLLKLATHAEDPVMPPANNDVAARNLTPEELGLLKLWITQGGKGSAKRSELSPQSWKPLPSGIQPVLSVALSPDGQFVACSRANQIFLYQVATGQLITRMSDATLDSNGYSGVAHRDLVQSMDFNADGDLLATGGFREIKLWRRPRDMTHFDLATSGSASVLRLSPDQKSFAVNTDDFAVEVRSASDGSLLKKLTGHSAQITGIQFSADGSQIYSSSLDKSVLIHTIQTGQQTGQIKTEAALNDVALVPTVMPSEEVPHPLFVVATAGEDGIIRIWDHPAKQGENGDAPANEQTKEFVQIAELKGHSKPVTCLAVVPGRPHEVLSGSRDTTMRWWRTSNAQQVRSYSHGGEITSIAAAPNGQTFASAGTNSSAKLWHSTGQQIAELKGDIRLNTAIARAEQLQKSAESRVAVAKRQLDEAEKDVPKKTDTEKKAAEVLAKANKDTSEKATTLNAAKEAKLAAEKEAVTAAAAVRELQALLDEANTMAELAENQVVQLQQEAATLQLAVNAAPGNEQLRELLVETQAAVKQTQEDAAQKKTATQKPTEELKVATTKASAAAQNIDKVQKPYNDSLAELNKSEDAQNLAAQQHALAATELKQAQELVPIRQKSVTAAEATLTAAQEKVKQAQLAAKASEQPVMAVSFSTDGELLLTAGAFKAIHSWDVSTGSPVASWEGHSGTVNAVAWLDPQAIISVSEDKTLKRWATNPGWRLERTIGSVNEPGVISHRVTSVDFSHDSQLLLAASGIPSRNGELHQFRVSDGEQMLRLPKAHDDTIYAARFSPDASRIASVGADRYLRTFDTKSGNQLRRFEGHTNYVLSVAWQSDGQSLASGAADNTVKIWDVETGDQRRTVSTFKRHITALGYSGTSDSILCVSGDRTVRMVRASNGGTIRNYSGTATWMHCAAMTPDGGLAAAGDAAGTLFVWNTTNGQLLHRLESPVAATETAAK